MKSKTAFMKKDLVVVLGCMVFVLMNIGAIGSGGRRRAKEAVCFSNLRQWGVIFQDYTDNNNGYFMKGCDPRNNKASNFWLGALRPYYNKDPKIRLCPEATKPRLNISRRLTGARNPFAAWGIFPSDSRDRTHKKGDYGSYGINLYVSNQPSNLPGGASNVWYSLGAPATNDWRTPNVKGADNVPVFLDSAHFQSYPESTDEPPEYSGEQQYGRNTIKHFCQNRHNGYVNVLFLDFSVRKIGLKELWTLKWHRGFDTEGPWTLAGGVTYDDWANHGDGWMKNFKDY